jgi:hypothetical protein
MTIRRRDRQKSGIKNEERMGGSSAREEYTVVGIEATQGDSRRKDAATLDSLRRCPLGLLSEAAPAIGYPQ